MADARLVAAVALGGALGSVGRYALSGLVTRGDVPWGTVAVNLLGSLVLGFLVFREVAGAGALTPEWRMFLAVGVLGGFTTMSTFAVELIGVAAGGDHARAAGYWLLNAVGSVGAAFAGRALAYAAA